MKQKFWNRGGSLLTCAMLCLGLLTGCGVMGASALAETGAPVQQSAADQTTGLIGEETAREAALERVGLADAVFTGMEYDAKDGVYELEFHDGVTEYEADVDAYTGAVVKLEQEPVDAHDDDDWDDCDDWDDDDDDCDDWRHHDDHHGHH